MKHAFTREQVKRIIIEELEKSEKAEVEAEVDSLIDSYLSLNEQEREGFFADLLKIIRRQPEDKQEEMADDITKIKEAVYNPDSGLYARLRELESWKETSTRIIWMVVAAVVSLSVATIYKSLL